MKTKILTAVCFTTLIVSSAVWGMDMGNKKHDISTSSSTTIHANGTVKQISENHESLQIFHNPIAALKWPAMNMPFDVVDHELTHSLKVGDKVDFEFIQKDGKNVIVRMIKQ